MQEKDKNKCVFDNEKYKQQKEKYGEQYREKHRIWWLQNKASHKNLSWTASASPASTAPAASTASAASPPVLGTSGESCSDKEHADDYSDG